MASLDLLHPRLLKSAKSIVAAFSLVIATSAAPLFAQEDTASNIETIYIVEFCHADVGFNAAPSVMQQRNHDRTVAALNIMDSNPSFIWTIETTYQLDNFLVRASAADLLRLKNRLAEGRMDFGANYSNLHSGNCSEEQLHRLAYEAKRFGQRLQFAPRTAFLNDVPGFTRAIPRVLAGSGVPFAVLGPNGSFGGRPDIPLQDRPFWWQGSDGSRVLTWITYGSYAEGFVEWGMLNLNTANAKIPGILAEYEAAGYPYDSVMVERAFDDTFPNTGMVGLVSQWNSTHTSPKMKLATAGEFFDHITNKYGDVFPTYQGDASGNWEDVTAVTPASTAMIRQSRSALPQLEALYTLLGLKIGMPYPTQSLRRAWKQSLIFDEHSGGGVGWPGLLTQAEIEQENLDFVEVATDCRDIVTDHTTLALQTAGPLIIPNGEAGLVVFNPLGGAHHGIFEVNCGGPQPADLRLIDPTGGPDPIFRWLDDNRSTLAIEATLPAYGWRRWKISNGGQVPAPPAWTASTQIIAGNYELNLSPIDGTATALVDHSAGIDWLAQPDSHSFFGIESGLHLEVFFSQFQYSNPRPVTVMVEDSSPLFRRARVFTADGHLLREYRLYEQELRLDLQAWMTDSKIPFVPFDDHSRHYGLTFPANLNLPTRLTIDGPDGFFQPGPDSLPGASLAHFGTSTGGILSGANGRWMSVSSLDAPTLDLGEMTGAPVTAVETNERAITFKLARHHDQGQVKGGQIVDIDPEPNLPDVTTFRFITRFGDSSATAPSRPQLQRDLFPPLFHWVSIGSSPAATPSIQSYFSLSGPADLTCLKVSESGNGVIIRLRAGQAGGQAQLAFPLTIGSAWMTDLVERKQAQIATSTSLVNVTLVPNGVVTILLLP